jgi:orotidine-5'-phosphate decarboxylase
MPFANNLLAAIADKKSRVCVGIDPMPDRLPDGLLTSRDPRAIVDAFYSFTVGVLDVVADVAACVKFQSAYFERFGTDGVAAYFALVAEAQQKGLLVIGDVKRGDIGATSEAYADAHLAPTEAEESATPDAITVNPMLGLDTLTPFADAAATHGKGLFVLVRTSNPGSDELQDVKLADGRTWSEMLADRLHEVATTHAMGGVSLVGAVVGATQPHTMASIRRRLPESIFLLPGYGTQGGTAETAAAAFAEDTPGAVVSASRSVLYAKPEAGEDWQQAVARAAKEMRDDLQNLH